MEHPHSDKKLPKREKEFLMAFMQGVLDHYWGPLYKYLEKNKSLITTFPALLLEQEQLVVYVGRYHIGIEYFGKEKTDKLSPTQNHLTTYHDLADTGKNLFEEIVGFKFESTAMNITLPLPPYSEDLVYPTNKGMDKLLELKWNWSAQSAIMGFNTSGFHFQKGQFTRIVNARFFDADENGLRTRHIKWLDLIPIEIHNETEETHEVSLSLDILKKLVEYDAHFEYPLPPKDDYKYNKLPQINRFIELIGNKKTTEPQLTKFLEQKENQFILTMGILSKKICPQLLLEWQSQTKDDIQPDFLIVRPNGYADIVEFKLPNTKSKTVVGRSNRETLSAELNSYISQTRVYKEYFEDPNNRTWVKDKFDINVRHPKRFLVVGRRWDFSNDVWKEIIDDYRDIEIITFDELIDGVVSQFYM